MSVAKRKFLGEIGTLVDRIVMVITVNDKKYTGTLSGIDPESLTLSLSDAKDEKGTQTCCCLALYLNASKKSSQQ